MRGRSGGVAAAPGTGRTPGLPTLGFAELQGRSGTSITGKWKGGVYGDNGGPAGYSAKVDIVRSNGTYKGHVVYPDYCSGKWVYKGKKNGWFRFREVITKDPGAASCVTPVAVKTKREGAKLRVVWTEPGGDQGHMLAHRR